MDQQTGQAARTGAPAEAFDADVHAQIGRQLRSIYDSVVSQPVPDRFLELLNQLDTKTGGEQKEDE
ncbi:hypothetical protein SLNSH_10115 [Alsobacter soli]|uniref:Anti-sigma factor NepR domain-containing protein n=2 Tax=Alsobacter soli TaxID=2109933 RepID=A0A2T1HUB6_9HYPH|nr:hypothetical protein SLNSH_10115 [Alsobacter soli]